VTDDEWLAKLPATTPLPASSDEAFERIAQLVRTVLGVPVALVSLVDQTQQVFPGAVGLPEPWQTERATPLSHSFCQHVVVNAAPLILSDARSDAVMGHNLAVRDLGVVAYAGLPLVDFDGRVVGSLCAIDVEPKEWTTAEIDLLADLAAACSAELQLRAAAVRAAAAAARARLLLDLSEALSVTTTVAEVSETVARVASSRLGAGFGGVTVLDERGSGLAYVDLGALPEEARAQGSMSLADDSPSSLAVRLGRPLFFESLAELAAVAPLARSAAEATGARAFAYLPLQLGAAPLGTLALAWLEPRIFSAEDRELIGGLARYTAQAVDRAMLLAERRDAARTLQEALLPALPEVSWVEVSGLYRPAHVADAVGGDWYDAFQAGAGGDGEPLTIVVGDVAGHDTAAAATMGQLQWSLRSLAVDASGSPARLLERLDRVIARTGTTRIATVVVAVLAPTDDGPVELTWSNAGHLPPVLLPPRGPATFLERPIDPLLGLSAELRRGDHSVTLPAGSSVLLFTDGLVERRGGDLQVELDAVLAAAERHRGLQLPALLRAILSDVLADGHDDDIVLFGVRT
jgi:serine phosphatase RsbU (regulator of sigma subunit)